MTSRGEAVFTYVEAARAMRCRQRPSQGKTRKKSVNGPFCPVLHIQFPSVPLYKQRLGKQDFQLLTALPWHPKKQQPTTPCKTACVFRPAGGDLSQIRVLLQCSPTPPCFFFSTKIINLLGPFMQQVS